MATKRTTISDVAARAGVDRAVVSKVLNDHPGLRVRPQTRERVHRAARELDYRPSALARSLRTSKTGAIGFVIPTFANLIWAPILDAAEAAADARGQTLLAGIAADDGAAVSRFLGLAQSGAVDGLLIASRISGELEGPGQVPVLYVNRRSPTGTRHVMLDDAAGARLATQHLIELGHQRIAHLMGPQDTHSGIARRQGFDAALTQAGLAPAGYAESRYTVTTGAQAMGRLLESGPRPTAVMCANVAAATGALAAARSAGVIVPEDLSVIAIHDIELADSLGPPLTTVRMPLEQLAQRAVDLLLDTAADAPVAEMIPGPMTLIQRASTAPPHS